MRKFRLRRPSGAMMVAVLALFVALGGTAFAGPIASLAKKVSGNSIIKKRSLSANRLAKNTLTGTEIKESGLGAVPFANAATNATNATNAGVAGTAGAANSLNGVQYVSGPATALDSTVTNLTLVSAQCPAGKKAIGGGQTNNGGPSTATQQEGPTAAAQGWFVVISDFGVTSDTGQAFAICASTP